MSVEFKFPSAEEITRDWGDRCDDFDRDCGCCQMWASLDLMTAKDAEIALLRAARNSNKEKADA